ncbi:MAG: hypothetical protein OEY00_12370, partial [Gammaproteobacteria bacterium]|nr:hypothetical protein [Gammaproteobacteria bacterium]
MRIAFLICCLSLFSCGGGDEDDNHGYGYEYDKIDEGTGIRLSIQTMGPRPVFESLVLHYLTTERCAMLTAPGPLVVVTDKPLFDKDGNQVDGRHWRDTHTIILSDYLFSPGRHDQYSIFKHEVVHHL